MYTFKKNVAERFYYDLLYDEWPGSAAIWVDFFPAPPLSDELRCRIYRAYHSGIRSGKITAADLDECVGDGYRLTQLVRKVDASLPEIKTSYDMMGRWGDDCG